VAVQRRDIVLVAGIEVVDAEHVVAARDEALAQVRAQETRAARDEDAFTQQVFHTNGTLNLHAPTARQNTASGGIAADVTIISATCAAVLRVPARRAAEERAVN